MENPFNKIKLTVLFFVIYFLLAILVDKLAPGDMCNPGGGFFYGFFTNSNNYNYAFF